MEYKVEYQVYMLIVEKREISHINAIILQRSPMTQHPRYEDIELDENTSLKIKLGRENIAQFSGFWRIRFKITW